MIDKNRREDLINKQGVCPNCKENNLEYGTVRFEGECCYFPYECKTCKLEGEEWYHMDFEGHNVYTEDGDIIEL